MRMYFERTVVAEINSKLPMDNLENVALTYLEVAAQFHFGVAAVQHIAIASNV